jgi:hypothetical protein
MPALIESAATISEKIPALDVSYFVTVLKRGAFPGSKLVRPRIEVSVLLRAGYRSGVLVRSSSSAGASSAAFRPPALIRHSSHRPSCGRHLTKIVATENLSHA